MTQFSEMEDQPTRSMILAPTTAALMLIDLQDDVLSMPARPHSAGQVLGKAASLAAAFRNGGGTVVFAHIVLQALRYAMTERPGNNTLPSKAGDQTAPIERHPSDILVDRRQWGAFYKTHLDQQLRGRGISTIVLSGVATNFGVEWTARTAYGRGYDLVFVEDAMSSSSTEAHRFSTEQVFPLLGRVRSTAQVLQMLGE